MVFVELIVVYAAHELALAQEGGAQGLRDANILESAVNRARMLFAVEHRGSTGRGLRLRHRARSSFYRWKQTNRLPGCRSFLQLERL
jgi:hypothetical protein